MTKTQSSIIYEHFPRTVAEDDIPIPMALDKLGNPQ